MNDNVFKFYSVLKNEDAMPYFCDGLLVAADGLGGSGSTVHEIDKGHRKDMRGDVLHGAFGDIVQMSPGLTQYVEELIAPMIDGRDDTSALWASRIVIARCVYALTEGEFKEADLSDDKVRARLADFIARGLHDTVREFGLQNGKYDGQLLLPTTLAFIRYREEGDLVLAETVWAGDSRCYALTGEGLKLLSVDDEDSSGAITNLFYADNKKVRLNYLRHEIAKPCVLMAVSDGIFDPFDPHDHLGVEHTLLSALQKSASAQEMAEALTHFYDGVHGDDATMAFVPLGFSDFGEIKRAFERRAETISEIARMQAEMSSTLAVANLSEEEAGHYVFSRTADRFDHIVPLLLDVAERGEKDIALTPAFCDFIANFGKTLKAEAEKARRETIDRALAELDSYVRKHPELVGSEILTAGEPVFHDLMLQSQFNDFKRISKDLATAMDHGNAWEEKSKALAGQKQALHKAIQEKIERCRKEFDDAWYEKETEETKKKRRELILMLTSWYYLDNSVKFGWGVQNADKLMREDRKLILDVQDYVSDSRTVDSNARTQRNMIDRYMDTYLRSWRALFDWFKKDNRLIPVLLSETAVRMFGLGTAAAPAEERAGAKGKKERLLYELSKNKEAVVADIVAALAKEYGKTSVIDGQYNATKLDLFRVYYRLKNNPDNAIQTFEQRLSAIEGSYTSLVGHAGRKV